MKALIYRTFGSPDVLEWVDDWPEPELGPDTVLVRTVAGGVNPKDVLLRRGKFSKTLAREPLPRASGMEASGHVVAVGANVRDFETGDAVYGMTNRFPGGVHVEIADFQQDELQHAPGRIPLEDASTVTLAGQTALQALRDCGRLESGQKVLINGASGGVGHFAVQIARAMGAEVHAVCGPRNQAFVATMGANAVYDYSEQPATAIETEFDVILDAFGKFSKSAFARQLGRRGIYVSTVPKPATMFGELLAWIGLSRSSRLVEVTSRAEDLQQLKAWIEQQKLVPHVERTFAMDEVADCHRHIETKRTVGKVCIKFDWT